MKNNQKGFINIILIAVVVILVAIGGYFVMGKKSNPVVQTEQEVTTTPDIISDTLNWKTYTNTQYGYELKYPDKLSLSTSDGNVNLSHSIVFDNYGGGCDMKGDSQLSKTLGDFGLSIAVVSGKVNPPYVDGDYSVGVLNGQWSYMGVEGCGQTKYYFPISNDRTLVITKSEIQILSDVVASDIKEKVLAVPGVISSEDSKTLLNQILSTFKFTTPTTTNQKLTLDILKNASFNSLSTGTLVKLINGTYPLTSLAGESQADYYVKLDTDNVVFGDLNGDGQDDAIVVLVSRSGGSGTFRQLAVVLNQNGNANNIANQDLGDRIAINSLTIQNGVISINVTPWDGGSGTPKTTQYKLVGDKLTLIY